MSYVCSSPSIGSWWWLTSCSKLQYLPSRQQMEWHPPTLNHQAVYPLPSHMSGNPITVYYEITIQTLLICGSAVVSYSAPYSLLTPLVYSREHLSTFDCCIIFLLLMVFLMHLSTSCCLLIYILKNKIKQKQTKKHLPSAPSHCTCSLPGQLFDSLHHGSVL